VRSKSRATAGRDGRARPARFLDDERVLSRVLSRETMKLASVPWQGLRGYSGSTGMIQRRRRRDETRDTRHETRTRELAAMRTSVLGLGLVKVKLKGDRRRNSMPIGVPERTEPPPPPL